MNSVVDNTLQRINHFGGSLTAEALMILFHNDNTIFGTDFDVDDFFERSWRRLTDSRHSRAVDDSKAFPDRTNLSPYCNVIPFTDPAAACAQLCISFLNRGFHGTGRYRMAGGSMFRGGIYSILLQQCAYWFSCMSINKETLILTPNWDQAVFSSDFLTVVESFCLNYDKKVFVVEVTNSGPFLRYPY